MPFSAPPCLLAIDQGTTSSRAIIFNADLSVRAIAQEEFPQHYPASGWVQHDAEDIWRSTLGTMQAAVTKAGIAAHSIAAIGITNQRETVVIWDRASGRAIHPAIVWQDRRTAEHCAKLKADGYEALVQERTGLLLDPYFSATKACWILDHVAGARAQAEAGKLAFGTIDTFLLWRLTGGRVHATDATNASRTMLLNIHTGEWDAELCQILNVPMAMLPEVKNSADNFGSTVSDIFDRPIPIRAIAGDQQAALVGQACFEPGMMKSTYGTGCFALLNTGTLPCQSENRLLTTIAYQLNGVRHYALEGSIFIAGAAVQWLRDGLGVIADAAETGALAMAADPAQNVYLVPAFVGLGAPWWDSEARGALYGLTRGTTKRELARAALECVGYQTRDLLDAMAKDWQNSGETILRVDGGMTKSHYTMQFLADILCAPVDRPIVMETTAMGAAYLAGLHSGLLPEPATFQTSWGLDHRFMPQMDQAMRDIKYKGWKDAIRRTLG